MAPIFFLLSHSKNRFALSLILLISLLLATLFITKQSLPIPSLSLSTSSQLSLLNTSLLNHSHSNAQPSISPSFPPLPSGDNSAAEEEEDGEKDERFIGEAVKRRDAKKCDLYRGRWVRDEEGRYPLYAPGSCPYVDEAFSCQENGRRDEDYLKWRWKPDDCELPRYKF